MADYSQEPFRNPTSGGLAQYNLIAREKVAPVLIVDKDGNPASLSGGGGGGDPIVIEPEKSTTAILDAYPADGNPQAVFSLNNNRNGFIIANDSDVDVRVAFSSSISGSVYSFVLYQGDTYIDETSYTGPVTVMSVSAGTGNIRVTELIP